jgi:hypothetical protein
MKRVTCKFVVQSASESVLVRKLATGGCLPASEGDALGDTGEHSFGYPGQTNMVPYRVSGQRTFHMLPVTAGYNNPQSENFQFFSSTPAGQLQLFNVMNCDQLKVGDEVYLHLEVAPKAE